MNEELRRSAAHVFVTDVGAPAAGEEDVHHLSRVLRLRDGERVTVADGAGSWRSCEWRAGELLAVGDVTVSGPPSVRFAVAVAPVKGDRTEWTVEKLVEIGIHEIIVLSPVDHSVVRWDAAKAESHVSRLQRIVRSAAAQSRRVHLPVVSGPCLLADVLSRPGAALAEPGAVGTWDGVSTVVIGPEGGFSAPEVSLAARTVDLGPTVLRADTAAVVAGTLMVAHSRR